MEDSLVYIIVRRIGVPEYVVKSSHYNTDALPLPPEGRSLVL